MYWQSSKIQTVKQFIGGMFLGVMVMVWVFLGATQVKAQNTCGPTATCGSVHDMRLELDSYIVCQHPEFASPSTPAA
jgi:hypothetical protein